MDWSYGCLLAYCFFSALIAADASAQESSVQVDVNLDVKHVVGGESSFNRRKHITLHSSLTENEWIGELDSMNYLMNELDVYFGRDNGQASWIFRATPQDPKRPNHPDQAETKVFGNWFKKFYDDIEPERREYEARSTEMIMGTNPGALYPTLSYWPSRLAGVPERGGKYILQDSEPVAEWLAEYLESFFRNEGDASGMPLPKYWEVVNEPDMLLNTGAFMMSSWENIFAHHNLVAKQIRSRLGERAPLIGGMTWGLHDLGSPDLSTRYPTQDYVERYYGKTPADRKAIELAYERTNSAAWKRNRNSDFFQWDVIWKGFIDECGENMDFYSIHLYDWSPTGKDPRRGTVRSGGHVEAVLEMLEWYQQHKYGAPKPWVISEYGNIPQQVTPQTDYRYADWQHVKTWNQMFLQILTRPDMVVKSMPFAPLKAKWGVEKWPDGNQKRYEASLMQTEHADVHAPEAEWYFTDKLQWYELWADVKGTRVDTSSSDPDVQVDAYVDGKRVFLILNNLEWRNTPVDLSVFGADDNTIRKVRMKHSYLGEGLSPTNIGRGVLADTILETLPKSVMLQPESTMIVQIEYADTVNIPHTSNERKYYGESLAGAGKENGAIHRTAPTQEFVTGQVNGVKVPRTGEAMLRITGRFAISQAIQPRLAEFMLNGHRLQPPIQTQIMHGREMEVFDVLGTDFEHTTHQELRVLEIPVPLRYLKENNEIRVRVQQTAIYTNFNIVVWEMTRQVSRSKKNAGAVSTIQLELLDDRVFVGEKRTVPLRLRVSPRNAAQMPLRWNSSDLTVAVVDQNGLVTGIKPGQATVTGTARDGMQSVKAIVTVTTVAPTGVTVLPRTTEVNIGEAVPLSAGVSPHNASSQTVVWTSSSPATATVSNTGRVTGVSEGLVTITAQTPDGHFQATSTVKVVPVALESVQLSPARSLLPVGSTLQVQLQFTPENATNRSVRWRSSNPGVATVNDQGLVTAISEGETDIEVVTSDENRKKDMTVTVVQPTEAPITLEAESFQKSGGPHEGFKIDRANGVTNWNQTGDWAEYTVSFSKSGIYQVTLIAGTPVKAAGVELLIDGMLAGKADVPMTGDWSVMNSTIITRELLVAKTGKHTIRIRSAGAKGAWQWNADRLELLLLAPVSVKAPE